MILAVALELGADLILPDEWEGRRTAQRLGLRVIGVVGILLEAKANGSIDALRAHMVALRQTAGFYLSDGLVEEALALAGESVG